MTKIHKRVSTGGETPGRIGKFVVSCALAILLPGGALAVDSTPRQTVDQAGQMLPLPPIRYLDSMRWMDWKPGQPVFKVDTLLLPDRTQPGVFRLPSDYERDLHRVS